MNTVTRGIRNAFRNGIRTVSIVSIVGLSIGLGLSMLIAGQAIDAKIQSVKSSVGNTVTVTPAGARGFDGGGEPLTTDQLAKTKTIQHVTSVESQLNDQLTSENTSLQSAIEPGRLGMRAKGTGDGHSVDIVGGSAAPKDIKLPVLVTGTTNPLATTGLGGGPIQLTSGKAFDGNSNAREALVGNQLAAKNNLQVGSTFQAYGQTITVVGIYDAGNKFANANLLMPLATVQELSQQPQTVTNAVVTVDSAENVAAVTSAIKSQLGDAADVVSGEETAKNLVEPLEGIKRVSSFSLLCSAVAASAIILMAMIMIVRERRREIGVLKAIGASNNRVALQFMSESATLTVLGAVVGIGIALLAANPLTQLLASNSQANGPVRTTVGGPGMAVMQKSGIGFANLQATIGWDISLYGLLAAVFIAVVGAAAATWLMTKIRPAEVMRAE